MEQIKLNAEVWKKVFASPLYQQTRTLFRQIFKRGVGFGDFDAMGITPEELERIRGPSEPIPFNLFTKKYYYFLDKLELNAIFLF